MHIDPNGDLVFYYTKDLRGDMKVRHYIPAKYVAMIRTNLAQGIPYWQASPVYELDRITAAFILSEVDLKKALFLLGKKIISVGSGNARVSCDSDLVLPQQQRTGLYDGDDPSEECYE